MMPDMFVSPLSSVQSHIDENGKTVKTVNSWGFATLLINIVCDRMTDGDKERCLPIVRDLVLNANPLLDVDELIKQGQESDSAAAILIQAAADALEEKGFALFGVER